MSAFHPKRTLGLSKDMRSKLVAVGPQEVSKNFAIGPKCLPQLNCSNATALEFGKALGKAVSD